VVVSVVAQFCRSLDGNLCDNSKDCSTGPAGVFGQLVLNQPFDSVLKLHCELLW